MSAIDPESLDTSSPVNPSPLLRDSSPELKSHNLEDVPRESLSTNISKEPDNVVALSDLCRFKFMRNALFLTSFYLFTIVGLAYLMSFAEPLPFSIDLYNLDHILGTDHFFTLSFVVCVLLSRFHSIVRVNILNFGLFSVYTAVIVNYIALKGAWTAFTSVSLGPLVCFCFPVQITCLAVYVTLKKKVEFTSIEILIPSSISLVISSIIILWSSIASLERFFFLMICLYIQLWYFYDVMTIARQDKSKMDTGDYLQAITGFSFVVYRMQIIMIILDDWAEFYIDDYFSGISHNRKGNM